MFVTVGESNPARTVTGLNQEASGEDPEDTDVNTAGTLQKPGSLRIISDKLAFLQWLKAWVSNNCIPIKLNIRYDKANPMNHL